MGAIEKVVLHPFAWSSPWTSLGAHRKTVAGWEGAAAWTEESSTALLPGGRSTDCCPKLTGENPLPGQREKKKILSVWRKDRNTVCAQTYKWDLLKRLRQHWAGTWEGKADRRGDRTHEQIHQKLYTECDNIFSQPRFWWFNGLTGAF